MDGDKLMAVQRITLDLAIPEGVYQSIPLAQKVAFRDAVRALKALAIRVNEGQKNEEMTVRATTHICHHDEVNVPCEPDKDI